MGLVKKIPVRGTINCPISHYNSMTSINQNERKCYANGIYLPVPWVDDGLEQTKPLPLLRSTGPGMTNLGAHNHVNASNYTTANHLSALCHLFTLATGTTNQPSALCASPANQHRNKVWSMCFQITSWNPADPVSLGACKSHTTCWKFAKNSYITRTEEIK